MDAIKKKLEYVESQIMKKLDEPNPFSDLVKKIESKTKLPRKTLIRGMFIVTTLWLMIGYGAQFLSNFIGFIYPAYASIKAIESHDKDDDTKWLTYWVTYSFFNLVEFFSDHLLYWIPFYWLFKCIIFVWLMMPGSANGSIILYERVIRPYFLKHEKKIDATLGRAKIVVDDVKDLAKDAAGDISKSVTDSVVDNLTDKDK